MISVSAYGVRWTVKVDKAEYWRKIDVYARRAFLAVKGARDPVQPPHIAQHLELVGDELLIGGRTGVIDDQPSLRAIELACALGIHELVVKIGRASCRERVCQYV